MILRRTTRLSSSAAQRMIHSCTRASCPPARIRPLLVCRNFSDLPIIHKSKSTDTDGKGKSYMEIEKDIASLQRYVRECYQAGLFSDAIDGAKESLKVIDGHFGKEHPVYASTLNDMAVMHKMMGEHEKAIESYQEALSIYKEIVGEEHPSFGTTLHNLGLLFKAMAEQATSLEKQVMLDRAEENLKLALGIRKKVLEPTHPDVALTMQALATVYRQMPAKKFKNQAEDLLVEAVELLQQNSGEETAVTATATNNLGMFYKLNDQPEKALPLYEKSYEIRREVLGDTHPDTIAVMHNLAELHDAMGNEHLATPLREAIIDLIESVR